MIAGHQTVEYTHFIRGQWARVITKILKCIHNIAYLYDIKNNLTDLSSALDAYLPVIGAFRLVLRTINWYIFLSIEMRSDLRKDP